MGDGCGWGDRIDIERKKSSNVFLSKIVLYVIRGELDGDYTLSNSRL